MDTVYNLDGQGVLVVNTATASPVRENQWWGGSKVSYYTTAGAYFVHQTPLGTVRGVTTAAGALAAYNTGYPFGDGTVWSGSDADTLLYAGLDHDAETNTEHAWARQYSSTEGVWTVPDPYTGSYNVNNPQSFNRYAYVLNNPLMYVDPSGLEDEGDDDDDDDGNPGSPGTTTGGVTSDPLLGTVATTFTFTGGDGSVSAADLPGSGGDSGAFGVLAPSDPASAGAGGMSGLGIDGGEALQQSSTDQALTKVADAADAIGMNSPGMQSAIDHIGTFVAGAGDFLSFGLTKKINDADGGSAFIDYGSSTYTAGKATGIGLTVASTAVGALTAGALREGGAALQAGERVSGGLFGRGGAGSGGVFNRGFLRFGMSWDATRGTTLGFKGVPDIRIGIGEMFPHIPVWFPGYLPFLGPR